MTSDQQSPPEHNGSAEGCSMKQSNQKLSIPATLRRELEDGQLVLFCGAGVSMNAGYKNYSGLLEEVKAVLGDDSQGSKGHEDRAFTLLEDQYGSNPVRNAVVMSLTRQPHAEHRDPLALHKAILDLATDYGSSHSRRVRLVTTNFDCLFESASIESGQSLAWEAGPRLANPDPERWNSLVYLHGRIDRETDPACLPRDTEHRSLVLTSADFGEAYMRVGWAARFVVKLFERFSVLFIGYSADDPIMQYILDALSAERRRVAGTASTPTQRVIALSPYSSVADHQEQITKWGTWKSLVEPIGYLAPEGDHSALLLAMAEWAAVHRRGHGGREAVVIEHCSRALPPEEEEDDAELEWALADPHGVGIRALVRPPDPEEKSPKVLAGGKEWLSWMAKKRLLEDGLGGRLLTTNSRRVFPFPSRDIVSRTPDPYEKRAGHLLRWLECVAMECGSPGKEALSPSAGLLEFVLEHGALLRTELSGWLRWRLAQHGWTNPILKDAWQIVANADINWALRPTSLSGGPSLLLELERIKGGQWDGHLKSRLIECIRPWLSVDKPRSWFRQRIEPQPDGRWTVTENDGALESIRACLEPRLVLSEEGIAYTLIEHLESSPRRDAIAADCWHWIQGCLERALDLIRMSCGGDWLSLEEAGVAEHGFGKSSGRSSEGLELLAQLTWWCYERLVQGEAPAAAAMLECWITSRSLLMRRLALHAGATFPKKKSTAMWRRILLEGNPPPIWDHRVEGELLQALSKCPESIANELKEEVCDVVLGEPPVELGPREPEDPDARRLVRNMRRQRLDALVRSGIELPDKAQLVHQALLQEWTEEVAENDRVENERKAARIRPLTDEEIDAKCATTPVDELAARLLENPEDRDDAG